MINLNKPEHPYVNLKILETYIENLVSHEIEKLLFVTMPFIANLCLNLENEFKNKLKFLTCIHNLTNNIQLNKY